MGLRKKKKGRLSSLNHNVQENDMEAWKNEILLNAEN